jgi:tRNA/tmRNA/rRNA uracil-C5-methylase (TrmA/RlmC/RlmD family)
MKEKDMRIETVEIKKIGINGEGIGYIDRKIVFVKGALIGENVEIEITQSNRNYYLGTLRKILTISKDRQTLNERQTKEAPEFSLLHIKYPSQLRFKKEAIRESIRKYTNYDLDTVVFKDVIGNKELTGFITQVNVPFVSYNNQISFGIYQRESKQLVLLVNNFRQHPKINQCLKQIAQIVNKHGFQLYNDRTKKGLRFLKAKIIDNDIQLVCITGRDSLPVNVIEDMKKIDNVNGLFVSVNTSRYQDFDEVGYTKVFGNTRLEMKYQEHKYLISVKSKLADNLSMYLKRIEEMIKMLSDSQKIISLHSGIGILELECDKEVIGIDEKNYHNEDAKLNQKWAKNDKVTFVKGDIDEKIVTYAKKKIYDTFVIQNGHFGLSDTIKDSIRLSKVQNIIYVCESHSTLAKDLADLEKQYLLEKIVALDSEAYTPHVTTIVKLRRR